MKRRPPAEVPLLLEDAVDERFPHRRSAMVALGLDPDERPLGPIVDVGFRYVAAKRRFVPCLRADARIVIPCDRQGRGCLAIPNPMSDPFAGDELELLGYALGVGSDYVRPAEVVEWMMRPRRRP